MNDALLSATNRISFDIWQIFYLFRLISVVNGGYGNWTLGTLCNVSCGVGIEIWRRSCDNPEPKYGGRNCTELGDSIEFRKCSREPCPSKLQIHKT